MLNLPLRRTWADITHIVAKDLDWLALKTIVIHHASGLDLIAAPDISNRERKSNHRAPASDASTRSLAIRLCRHGPWARLWRDFHLRTGCCRTRSCSFWRPILLPSALASAAIETYNRLGYGPEKVQVVVNWTFQRPGFARKDIEAALRLPIRLVLPFAPERFVGAINQGAPVVYTTPEDPVAALIEDFAFKLSKEQDQTTPPAAPKPGWLRVKKRLAANNSRRK